MYALRWATESKTFVPMFTRLNDDEIGRRKRELHLRIGRSRRMIDCRLHAAGGHARQLLSWRRHVARHPGWALTAALGGGMAASTLLRPAPFPLAGPIAAGPRVGRTAAEDLGRCEGHLEMSEVSADRPLLADLREDLAALGGELHELAAARWELARLEAADDWRAVKRLAVGWLTAAVAALGGAAAAGGSRWPTAWRAKGRSAPASGC